MGVGMGMRGFVVERAVVCSGHVNLVFSHRHAVLRS